MMTFRKASEVENRGKNVGGTCGYCGHDSFDGAITKTVLSRVYRQKKATNELLCVNICDKCASK